MREQTYGACCCPSRGQTGCGSNHDAHITPGGSQGLRLRTIIIGAYVGKHAVIIVETNTLCKPIYRCATTTEGQITSSAGQGTEVAAAAGAGARRQIGGHLVADGGH